MEVQSTANGHHAANGNGVATNGAIPAKQFKSSDNGNRSKVTNFNAGPSKIDDSVSVICTSRVPEIRPFKVVKISSNHVFFSIILFCTKMPHFRKFWSSKF